MSQSCVAVPSILGAPSRAIFYPPPPVRGLCRDTHHRFNYKPIMHKVRRKGDTGPLEGNYVLVTAH